LIDIVRVVFGCAFQLLHERRGREQRLAQFGHDGADVVVILNTSESTCDRTVLASFIVVSGVQHRHELGRGSLHIRQARRDFRAAIGEHPVDIAEAGTDIGAVLIVQQVIDAAMVTCSSTRRC